MRYLAILGATLLISLCVVATPNDVAGKFVGTWSGSSGGGDIRLSLGAGSDGKWKCSVTFTFGGEEVKTTVKSVKVEGNVIEVQYEYDIGGTMRTTIKGRVTGRSLEGTYQAAMAPDGSTVDEGTIKAAKD